MVASTKEYEEVLGKWYLLQCELNLCVGTWCDVLHQNRDLVKRYIQADKAVREIENAR